MKRVLMMMLLVLPVAFVGACGGGGGEQTTDGTATDTSGTAGATGGVTVELSPGDGSYGEFLTDDRGRSLYLFMADSAMADSSSCYNLCAQAWPPLQAEGGAPSAGPGVQANLLGTIQRRDGPQQVTYNGWPLYYFSQDAGPGDTNGQDVNGFGADWYLVSPQGEPIHAEGGAGPAGAGTGTGSQPTTRR